MIGDVKGNDVHVEVICINDKDRPSDFPLSKWVKEGQKYTIVEFMVMNTMGGRMAVRLAEIDLSDNFPYLYFLAERFGIPMEQLDVEAVLEKAAREGQQEFEKIESPETVEA